ncbi:MAG TPA: hypothetical protein VFN05_13540, partial [Actinomycetes bacterium]|nr:hypothetical protein [Actinomycetes bacterium]
MGGNRRPHLTTAFVVVAVLLGSLWAGGLAVPAAGGPAGQLTAGASLPGIEPAALPDRVPALRPTAERSSLSCPRVVATHQRFLCHSLAFPRT